MHLRVIQGLKLKEKSQKLILVYIFSLENKNLFKKSSETKKCNNRLGHYRNALPATLTHSQPFSNKNNPLPLIF